MLREGVVMAVVAAAAALAHGDVTEGVIVGLSVLLCGVNQS